MKLVTAVIKPHMIEPVTSALHAIDVEGITITEVRGHGRQRGHTEVFRGAEYKVDYLPKIRVEIVTDDDEVEKVVATITEAARTGKIGDGKIWVTGVDSVVRIRTGELDHEAL
jgi:nitrogen regulatory protein P-II 1